MNFDFPKPSRKSYKSGFTLVELLVVVAIIAIIGAVSIPGLLSALIGTNLTRAGQLIESQIGVARQEAVAKNQTVYVIFYKLTHGSVTGWCAVQIWRIETASNGTIVPTAVSKLTFLPDGIIINATNTYSPLLAIDPLSALSNSQKASGGAVNPSSYGATSITGFGFRPNGSLDNVITTSSNFITLQGANAKGSPPANYYTLQVNPVGGRVTSFRP